ncbi:hypothetical protein AI3021V1_2736 [Klebsiella pneumoniae]|nr:hypothetical protein AI3021V1_2736 [Klebsiella pneumoniae]CAH5646461.1 hypothetical protein AI3021V1_2736 [Klebsiella pneumoniae]SXW86072.1 Eaa1 [Klebsiella pneumoniae]
MTKSTITREQLEEWVAQFDEDGSCDATDQQLEALIRQSLAAMAGEPVAFTEKHEISNMHATGLYLRAWPADRARNAVEGYTIPLYTTPQPISLVNSEPVAYIFKHPAGRLFWALTDESNKGQNDVMPVYASPQPAPERDQVRIAHAEWSQATFGNVGPVGPLKHLSKEALETAADPDDLSEWADMQFLLWDAQRRAGVTDEQITQAMIDKLAVNKQRKWPEPKDGEPRLHIKEQPAPVVPDSYVMVPMRLTAENGAKGALSGEFSETKFVNCPECFGDDECETCDGSGRIEITVPVTWTTIKEIWAKGVEHFSATAQENN